MGGGRSEGAKQLSTAEARRTRRVCLAEGESPCEDRGQKRRLDALQQCFGDGKVVSCKEECVVWARSEERSEMKSQILGRFSKGDK